MSSFASSIELSDATEPQGALREVMWRPGKETFDARATMFRTPVLDYEFSYQYW